MDIVHKETQESPNNYRQQNIRSAWSFKQTSPLFGFPIKFLCMILSWIGQQKEDKCVLL